MERILAAGFAGYGASFLLATASWRLFGRHAWTDPLFPTTRPAGWRTGITRIFAARTTIAPLSYAAFAAWAGHTYAVEAAAACTFGYAALISVSFPLRVIRSDGT